MWTNRAARIAALIAAVLGAMLAGSVQAGTWKNHIDASMTHEIVPKDDLLYMATYGGILVFDPATGKFEQYRNDDGLPSNALRCLAFDPDGDIYVGTADIGVAKVRISNGRLSRLRVLSAQIDGLSSNTINSVAVWGDVIVYGATPGVGTIVNDFAAAHYFKRDGLPGSDVLDVLPLGDEVWMATWDDTTTFGGLATLDKLGIIRKIPGGTTEPYVLGTDGANIWVGTNTGVRRYDPVGGIWTDMGLSSVPAYRVRSLFWTGTTMWAGTGKDFMRYQGTGTGWDIYSTNTLQNSYQLGGAAGLEIKGLAVLPDGDVYLGSGNNAEFRGPNLMHFDGTTVDNFKPNTPGSNDTRRLDIDIDGSLWASWFTFYVGKLMTDGHWLNYNTSVPGIETPNNAFTNIAFLADSQGEKWFSSLTQATPTAPHKLLDQLDDHRNADYGDDDWIRHDIGSGGGDGYGTLRPQRAAEDPAGNRWFLSDDAGASFGWQGIHILSRDKSEWFQMTPVKEPRMITGNVVDVAFSGTSTYVAFDNEGVYRWGHGGYSWSSLTNYPTDTWTAFVPANQLPGAATVITRIALRSDGLLWVATTSGLFYSVGGLAGNVPVYSGISPGIVSPKVQDIVLDHDENLWVATDQGLNRLARDDNNDIQTFLTPASYANLAGLRYSLDVIAPLAHADCRSLAMHPTRDVLYVGTFGGISEYDFSAPAVTETDLSKVYVYPNPVYTSKGHTSLKIANLTGPVTVEIYTLEGELVDSRAVAANGDVAWDLATRDGFSASSGKYIVRIIGENGSVQRPVALVR